MKKKIFGQSIVEFVLVLPLFLLVVLFILDIGRAVFIYSGMTHAIREGARLGSVLKDCDDTVIQNQVDEMSTFQIDVDVVCTEYEENFVTYYLVIVHGDYDFTAATPFIQNLFLDGKIVISAESTMHREFVVQ